MARGAKVLWQEHPDHGRMPVYDSKHAERNRKNGWRDIEEPKGKPTKRNALAG